MKGQTNKEVLDFSKQEQQRKIISCILCSLIKQTWNNLAYIQDINFIITAIVTFSIEQ